MGIGSIVAFTGAAPAGATVDGATVVYSATSTTSAPPASSFASSAGGDGWGLAFTSTNVYNVFHHNMNANVECHVQSDGSVCPGYPKEVTDGSTSFSSSGMPGLWMDQSTGHLYMFTSSSDNTGGVLCIDTTSSNANPFCGFTALTAVGDAPSVAWSGITDPVQVGTNWYAFNYVNGTISGDMDKLMCFSLTTLSACASQPYAVDLGGITDMNVVLPAPGIAAVTNHVVIPVSGNAGDKVTCFDTTTNALCSGSWPISPPSGFGVGNQGAPFPSLTALGVPNGVCFLGDPNDTCVDLSGVAFPTQFPNMDTVFPGADSASWNGPAVTIGARVYVPLGNNSSYVGCYDYSQNTSCANYPKDLPGVGLVYTVTQDPLYPTCLWTNADNASDPGSQITAFDAYTGGVCGADGTRVLFSSYVAAPAECQPTQYLSLSVDSPTASSYTSGTVDFQDFNGNPIPGLPMQTLSPAGILDLTSFNLTNQALLPQMLLNLTGVTASSVTITLKWQGKYHAVCLANGQTVSDPTPTPTPVLAATGSDLQGPLGLGAVMAGLGAVGVLLGRRRRAA